MRLALSLLLAAAALTAQDLTGVVDLHIHASPDIASRSITVLEAAHLARENGLRAIVLKNHYESTASLAAVAQSQVTGVKIFGGVALNRAVGGINPAAVEYMVQLPGGHGKLVWMPTFDSEHAARTSKSGNPFVSVSRSGRVLPEVGKVLELIAKYDLVLATGHSSPAECLMLLNEAKNRGVKRMIVTHASMDPIKMQPYEMERAARLGAYIEFAYNGIIDPNTELSIDDYVGAIRTVGVQHVILTSDLGQEHNPPPPKGFQEFLEKLRIRGFSRTELVRMSRANPARLLGLE
jgi:uncharacterized protein DUF6282